MKSGVSALRACPLLQILQGHSPETPLARTGVYPIQAGTVIKQGMVVSPKLVSGVYYFVPGLVSGAEAFIAYNDSSDPIVSALDQLIGISMSGEYLLETGYFNKTDAANFVANAELSAYADDDGTAANRGLLKVAAQNDRILAVIPAGFGVRDLHAPADGGLAEESLATDGRVVTIQTVAVSGRTKP